MELLLFFFPWGINGDLTKPMGNRSSTRTKENDDEVEPPNCAIDVDIAMRSIGAGTLEWGREHDCTSLLEKTKGWPCLALLCVKKRLEYFYMLSSRVGRTKHFVFFLLWVDTHQSKLIRFNWINSVGGFNNPSIQASLDSIYVWS